MDKKRVLIMSDMDQHLMIKGLSEFRNDLIKQELPTEDINDLMLRIIDAPVKRKLVRDYDSR